MVYQSDLINASTGSSIDVASALPNRDANGLSSQVALDRLNQEGYNELPSSQTRSIWSIAWEAIQDPIFLLLVGGGIVYWILGDLQEALILLGFVLFITGISLYQEGKTEHALEALRDLSSPRALVIRDGQRKRIAGREVVRGDILVLAEGDSPKERLRQRVPADAIVLSCSNLSAVETLGSATVLCVDKTGTLTLNQMAVQQLLPHHPDPQPYDLGLHSREPLPEVVHELVEYCILASQRDPFDPMEKAFKQLGVGVASPLETRYLADTEHLHDDWQLLREYPLSPDLPAMSHVWQSADGKQYEIAAKGAPEAIADLCHFTPQQQQILATQVSEMANLGLRVLGVARAALMGAPTPFLPPHPSLTPEHLPDKQHDFPFQFLGLVGLADPVRPTVAAAIQECHTAGVRVVMITGDYPATAQTIARQIGLLETGDVITGAELDLLSDTELQHRIQTTNIFARAVPEQKLRLVTALQAKGEVVAMTGDGVNDAPALKAAQIGIAMGERGTDVARESAALVLLDDDFSSLAKPLPWRIVFEAEPAEANVMNRPPRNPHEPLFGRKTISLAVLQGLGILAIVLVIFVMALDRGLGELDARALTFTTLILANLGLIISERSSSRLSLKVLKSPNAALWWVVGGGLVFLALVLYVPFLQQLFSFSVLHLIDLAICLAGGAISFVWFECLKLQNKSSNG
jgi:P-type Ca2+ transporter type 2C